MGGGSFKEEDLSLTNIKAVQGDDFRFPAGRFARP